MSFKISNLFVSAAICLALLSGCSKDDSDTDNNNNGDYSPLTANSTWTYKNNPEFL